MLAKRFSRRVFYFVALLALSTIFARAQGSVVWTTNFYSVTGANFREIRESIVSARPWRDDFDGDTRWEVHWRFTTAQSAGSCSCSSYNTSTRITTTLPRWTPPADVMPEVKEQWTRYFTNLAQHELGHARFGLAAAAEVERRIAGVGAQTDCAQLKQIISDRANQAIAEYRRREVEYDANTNHGRRRNRR
jgi:predicted secreted Zn-dependent protease